MDPFPLGRFSVARIGFGAIQLPGPGAFGPPRARDAALAVLRRAVDLGVAHIDTAQFYGPNVSTSSSAKPCIRIRPTWRWSARLEPAATTPAAGCRRPPPPASARISRPTRQR